MPAPPLAPIFVEGFWSTFGTKCLGELSEPSSSSHPIIVMMYGWWILPYWSRWLVEGDYSFRTLSVLVVVERSLVCDRTLARFIKGVGLFERRGWPSAKMALWGFYKGKQAWSGACSFIASGRWVADWMLALLFCIPPPKFMTLFRPPGAHKASNLVLY